MPKKKNATKKTSRKELPLPERSYIDQLSALKVDDPDLDRFANYFGALFEHRTEPTLVMVELLQRLNATSAARKAGSLVDVEDVTNRLSERLFINSLAGENAAREFAAIASQRAHALLMNA